MSSTPFFDSIATVQTTIDSAVPPSESLKSISHLLNDIDVHRVFFTRLSDPKWIGPLDDADFFDNPPPVRVSIESKITAQLWPQSRYLVRMATLAPMDVAHIIAKINTDNWLIAGDMYEAGSLLSGKALIIAYPSLLNLTKNKALWTDLSKIGNIITTLANDNQSSLSIELANSAFSLDTETAENMTRRHFEDIYIDIITKHVVPALLPVRTRDTLLLLLHILELSINIKETQDSGGDDFSFVWRPAIENHDQNHDYDIAAKFVTVVRDAFDTSLSTHDLSLSDALVILNTHTGLIYRRIELYLITMHAEMDRDLAIHTLMNKDLFNEYGCVHEHSQLIRKRFDYLSSEQQAEWFSWIDKGPESLVPNYLKGEMNNDIKHKRIDHWKFNKLHWVKDYLSGSYKVFYDKMLKETGIPLLSDLHSYSYGMRTGYESPYSSEDLSRMTLENATDTAISWQPDPLQSSIDAPNIEGLLQEYKKYVFSNATTLSELSRKMINRPAAFVRRFIEGISEAYSQSQTFNIDSILELCQWVVEEQVNAPTARQPIEGTFVDQDWQWTRDSIAKLIDQLCSCVRDDGKPLLGLEYQERIWQIVCRLPHCPAADYLLRDEDNFDPRTVEWTRHAINSSRGKAMEAVFSYLDWLVNHEVDDRKEHKSYPGKPDLIEHVLAFLADLLKRTDGDFTDRAEYGRRIGLLRWLDDEWTSSQIDAIFDLETYETDPEHAYGWAAWNVFLFSNNPHKIFFDLLSNQYEYALSQAESDQLTSDSREKPFARMAMHLIVLYGRGNLGQKSEIALKSNDAMIERLITKTHPSIRMDAIQYIGSSLQPGGEILPESTVKRFTDLWDYYWNSEGESDATEHPNSSMFGRWFTSEAFDDMWSINRLEEFVKVCPLAEPDFMIAERLATICEADLLRSTRIIGMLVEGSWKHNELWRISSWNEHAENVLSKALSAGGNTKEEAERIIDRLGRLGFMDFGVLLDNSVVS